MKKTALLIVSAIIVFVLGYATGESNRMSIENQEQRLIGTDAWFEKNAKTRTGQPEELLKLADEIGLKHIRKTNLRYVEKDQLNNSSWAYATYHNAQPDGFGSGRYINIVRGSLEKDGIERLKVTLAHEYLHYIWHNNEKMQNDENLEAGLLKMYGELPYLQERIKPYVKDRLFTLTELMSYSCTEIPDKYMDQYVLEECNKWVNRSELKFNLN